MNAWNVTDAQENLDNLVQAANSAPQMLCVEDQTVAVMIGVRLFRELIGKNPEIPSMAELMAELELIRAEEPIEFDLPERVERPSSLLETQG